MIAIVFRLLESDGDTGLAGEPGGVPRGSGSGPSSLGSRGGGNLIPLLALLGGGFGVSWLVRQDACLLDLPE